MNFRSAQAARLDSVPDTEVPAFAAEEGRILVSHDFQTMPGHFRQSTRGRRSPGLLLVRQDLPVGEAIETLLLIWEASEEDEWVNRLCLGAKLGHDCSRWLGVKQYCQHHKRTCQRQYRLCR